MENLKILKTAARRFRNSIYEFIPANYFWDSQTKRYYDYLMKSQWDSHESIVSMQKARLEKLLAFAYANVPHYQKTFRRLGIVPGDIRSAKDLSVLPIIDKQFVLKNYEDFVPKYDFKCLRNATTSGSSGVVLSFKWHPEYYNMKNAANNRHYQWAGVKWNNRIVRLGAPLFNEHAIQLYVKDTKSKTWHINTAKMDDKSIAEIFALINKIQPDHISGFPSVIHLLARYLRQSGKRLVKNPTSIMTVSETVFDTMKDVIEETFSSRIYDWYGMIEGCASAAQCEYGSYHINSEYCIIEFIEQDGLNRIVGTNLTNFAFPLIRYDTGDIGESVEGSCSCGRLLPLMKPSGGRITNLLKTKEGQKYIYANYFSQILQAPVKEFQVVQNSFDVVDLYLVREDTFNDGHYNEINSHFGKYLGDAIKLQIHFVDRIEKSAAGKYQTVVVNI